MIVLMDLQVSWALKQHSHKAKAGNLSVKTECARLMTSDSVVGLEVEVCHLLSHVSEKCELGPLRLHSKLSISVRTSLKPIASNMLQPLLSQTVR